MPFKYCTIIYQAAETKTKLLPGEESVQMLRTGMCNFISDKWKVILHVAFPPCRCGFLFC